MEGWPRRREGCVGVSYNAEVRARFKIRRVRYVQGEAIAEAPEACSVSTGRSRCLEGCVGVRLGFGSGLSWGRAKVTDRIRVTVGLGSDEGEEDGQFRS